ncbi:multicopper oxidase domain-containing protein [Nitrospina gracilis]|uniref:multicopper oxidase domain-containing protein n=1 Tax=Nitrospina gracilis TaxID=35801 RepID=UPI001F007719|nr:multicopper oxidase domain-containing protein [Nitrospina gracilis]MCF8719936.1 nitrite reductase (NO-forming) [Nitrospina gracilis Nb-211]
MSIRISPLLWLFAGMLASPAIAEDLHHHPHRSGHLPSVGPGEAPHFHEVDVDQLIRVDDIAKRPHDLPPPIQRKKSETVKFKLEFRELVSTLSPGTEYVFWTFDSTVPGPLLRARVGDTVELTLTNHATSTHSHSIDLHAVTGPGGGSALSEVKPGETRTIAFKALHSGVYLYHCATPNVPSHITNGLYGLIVIDPEDGWPQVDREFYIMQGEFYTRGAVGETGFQDFSPDKMMREQPEYIVWNGRVQSLTGPGALKVKQRERIRIFVGNGGVARVLNFHIIGEVFDRVYPEGAMSPPRHGVQTTLVPAGGASAVELTLENAGDYVLLDHAIARIDRGSYGLLTVEGAPIPSLLSSP